MSTKRIYSAQEAEGAFKKLPQEIRSLLYSTEMRKILMDVGEKNKLHLDQLATLEAETGAVMLGFTDTNDYPEILSEALRVDSAKAQVIAKDISEQLFSKIRAALNQPSMQQQNQLPTTEKAAQKPVTATAPSTAPVKPSLTSVLPTKSELLSPKPTVTTPQVQPSKPVAPTQPPQPPAPSKPNAPTATPPTPAAPPKPPQTVSQADVALTQKTVSIPKPPAGAPTNEAPKPANYKTDPYREPPE